MKARKGGENGRVRSTLAQEGIVAKPSASSTAHNPMLGVGGGAPRFIDESAQKREGKDHREKIKKTLSSRKDPI